MARTFFFKKDHNAPIARLRKLKYSTKASICLLAVLVAIASVVNVADQNHLDHALIEPLPMNENCSVTFKDDRMKLCYFVPYEGNFGDELGPAAVDRILENHFRCVSSIGKLDLAKKDDSARRQDQRTQCLFTVGSIFHMLKLADHIWGTGINPHWQSKGGPYPRQLQIYSVRGPNTEELIHKNLGMQGSISHGDPGFLVPLLYSEFKIRERPYNYDQFCMVPHFHDIQRAQQDVPRDVIIISPSQPWRPVLQTMAEQCDFVASSSLHGMIVADALGIPSLWFQWTDTDTKTTEGSFKYIDYLASIGRHEITMPLSDVSVIKDKKAYSSVLDTATRRSIANRTISSFPYHLFESSMHERSASSRHAFV